MGDTEVLKATLQRELDALQETGQELWLQAALARVEVRTELHRIEDRFRIARELIARLGAHGSAARGEIASAVRALIDELQRGYAQIARQV